jgi:hypothetical protein
MPNDVREKWARRLHTWYLEATAKLHPESYNPKARKSYDELTDEQKSIDLYIADSILSVIGEEIEGMRKQVRYEKTDRTMELKTGKVIYEHKNILYDREEEIYNQALTDLRARLEGK